MADGSRPTKSNSSLASRSSQHSVSSSHASLHSTSMPIISEAFTFQEALFSQSCTPEEVQKRFPGEIERRFVELINARGLDRTTFANGQTKDSETSKTVLQDMQKWPLEKKWQLVHTHAVNESQAARTQKGSSLAATPLVGSITNSNGSDRASIFSISSAGSKTPKGRSGTKKDRPEDYLQMFVDNSITAKKIASLNVGLRTYEIS